MRQPLVDRQLAALSLREEKFLAQAAGPLTTRLAPAAAALEQTVPLTLRRTLEAAFSKSFLLVFEKGDPLIRRSSDLDAIAVRHRTLDAAVSPHPKRKQLRAVDRQAKASGRFHLAATAVEGAGLGLLGVGLPDIPIFLGMLLREGYEIAAS
ncbi:MAG: EcsC family protein, partial [Oscillospiraceae bacterium]